MPVGYLTDVVVSRLKQPSTYFDATTPTFNIRVGKIARLGSRSSVASVNERSRIPLGLETKFVSLLMRSDLSLLEDSVSEFLMASMRTLVLCVVGLGFSSLMNAAPLKIDKQEKVERPDKPEKSEKPKKPEKADAAEKSDKEKNAGDRLSTAESKKTRNRKELLEKKESQATAERAKFAQKKAACQQACNTSFNACSQTANLSAGGGAGLNGVRQSVGALGQVSAAENLMATCLQQQQAQAVGSTPSNSGLLGSAENAVEAADQAVANAGNVPAQQAYCNNYVQQQMQQQQQAQQAASSPAVNASCIATQNTCLSGC